MVKPIQQRERALIYLYAHWQFELDLVEFLQLRQYGSRRNSSTGNLNSTWRSFYTKWDVTYEQIAVICSRSVSTVRHWFQRGKNYRAPSAWDQRHLALMDFLLENFEKIPPEFLFR